MNTNSMSAQHTPGPWMSWRVIVEGVGEIGFAHGRDEQEALDHAIQEYGQLGGRPRVYKSSKQIYEDDDYRVEPVGSAPMKIETKWGVFTIIKLADKDYEVVEKDGAFRVGRVTKRGRGWYTELGTIVHTSRHDAIHTAITEWYQKQRSATNPHPSNTSRAEAWEDGFAGREMQWCATGSAYARAYREGASARAAIAKATGETT